MAAVATTSLFTPLLILHLLESLPPIMAEPPSSDDSSSNTATPATNISPTVATICLVSVGFFFLSGFFFVTLRWIMDAGWCGFRRSGEASLGVGGEGPQRGPVPDGVTQEAEAEAARLQANPTYLYKDVKMHRRVGEGELECAVCLSEFEDHEALRRLPKCSHVFHPHCVDPWLVCQVTCPVCRAVLRPSKSDHAHRSGSSEAEASGDHPDHVITIDHNSPVSPALNRSRPSAPDLTTEDSTVDRDEQLTLTLPAEEAANAMWQLQRARSERKGC